ncbi:MAG: hypothetical protein JNJ50_09565 [Acidobacteria bacterium]|nr:hypothetical protein [Acidobacteriota bacterium]
MVSQRISLTPARLLLLLLFGALCLFVALSTQATIMQRLEIEDLTRLSSDVFHGQILSTETRWNPEHTRIYTDVRVRINEAFKGTAKSNSVVTVTQLGGEKDGVKVDYAGRPEFTTGESVVLFTTRTQSNQLTVVALKQGKLQVKGAEVTRDFSGLTLVQRTKQNQALQPVAARPDRLTMDELRTRIVRSR